MLYVGHDEGSLGLAAGQDLLGHLEQFLRGGGQSASAAGVD